MKKKMLKQQSEIDKQRLFIKSGLKWLAYFFHFLFFETMLYVIFTWSFTKIEVVYWLILISLGLELFAWILQAVRKFTVRFWKWKIDREIRKTQEINLQRKEHF